MKTQKIIVLNEVLTKLAEKQSPLKLTIARGIIAVKTITEEFNLSKSDKFNDLVKSDELGNPVPTKALKEAIEKGLIKPNDQVPFEAYEFESVDGFNELSDHLHLIRDKEVDIKLPSVKLSKLIRVGEDDISLEDLLEASDSVIDSYDLGVLLEAGIITE
tara:strand:+ start:1303 stop:1782 length:480 start_codon:yes stop_codon:yes gene_type:complete